MINNNHRYANLCKLGSPLQENTNCTIFQTILKIKEQIRCLTYISRVKDNDEIINRCHHGVINPKLHLNQYCKLLNKRNTIPMF